SSRQALEQARVATEELEDVKAVVKRLEEENAELRRQARHAVRGSAEVPRGVTSGVTQCPSRPCPPQEKEQRSLCSRAEGLQEERLLAEGQGLREQIQVQAARMANLEVSTVAMVSGAGGCV
ncbi:KASH5 protein, partial [Aphelocoma coerulescens]|nr:KASH5 protein [Aphelocoma coerulescens]